MTRFVFLLIMLFSVSALGQDPVVTVRWKNAGSAFVSSVAGSPLHHLGKPASTNIGVGSICPIYYYFDPSAGIMPFTQNLPSSRFAVKVTPTSVCTVWTINLDFDIISSTPSQRDTIYLFMKEATPPHNTMFEGYYLTRVGNNQFQFEIFPVPLNTPPAVGTAVVNPMRDFFIGAWIKGDPSHSVTWKFKTPQIYGGSYPRSVCFTSPATWVSASSIVGQPVDWYASATICITPPVVPVELTSLRTRMDGPRVVLDWETASERNNHGFLIERSAEANGEFTPVGFVEGRGTSVLPNAYSWTDDGALLVGSDLLWYRLQQIDIDGTRTPFGPVLARVTAPTHPTLAILDTYPHPYSLTRRGALTLRYQLPEDAAVRVTAVDLLGRTWATVDEGPRTAGIHSVSWFPPHDLTIPSGMLLLRLQAGDRIVHHRVLLQR